VAHLPKARTVRPEKQPLLANGSETTFIAGQQILNKQEQTVAVRKRFGKHVPAATDMHTRMNDVACAARVEQL
jgi:hypothetical protein